MTKVTSESGITLVTLQTARPTSRSARKFSPQLPIWA